MEEGKNQFLINVYAKKIKNIKEKKNVYKKTRKICKKYGNPGLVCTEMISSKGLYYNDKKTEQFLELSEEKRPIAIQIFGSDAQIMGQIAKKVEIYGD